MYTEKKNMKYDFSWIEKYKDKINSVLIVWQGGMESGNGIADVLSGKVSPSGKLTDTIAVEYKDYPSSENFGNAEFNNYEEDIEDEISNPVIINATNTAVLNDVSISH